MIKVKKKSQNCLDPKDIKRNAANQKSQNFLILPRVINLFPVSDIDTWKENGLGADFRKFLTLSRSVLF